MEIKKIQYSDLAQCENALDEFNIILYDKPSIVYFGLFKDDCIVSIMAVELKGNHYKFRANYTPEKFRCNGYNSILLHELCKVFNDKPIVTEANNWSMPLYKNNGFIITSQRQCKYWVKYFMRKDVKE